MEERDDADDLDDDDEDELDETEAEKLFGSRKNFSPNDFKDYGKLDTTPLKTEDDEQKD